MGVDEASFAYELELEYEKSLDESMTVTSDERVADAVNDSRLVVPAARRSAHFALAPVAEPVDTMVAALAFALAIFLVDFTFSISTFSMDRFLKYKYAKTAVGVKT
jgi:hypothetical protein